MSTIRQPIVSVLGHVDSGKTTLLDHIRGSVVAEKEAGGITQMIGATSVPLDKISEVGGDMLEEMDVNLKIPGLLFIDTPGHAAFTSLRRRGGALSDIAVVVVDINDGVQPQTREAIEILKETETPFLIALNKIDTLQGWKKADDRFAVSYHQQGERVRKQLDEVIYELMATFDDLGFTVDRYDRVDDFQKKIGIVPISAETGEGVPDLLMALSGLSQRYLADRLEVHGEEGQGTVLEVNEVKGLGTTIDVILYNGMLRSDDTLVIGGEDGAVVTRVKALLEPAPLEEIREERDFQQIDEVGAAAGIKIAAPDLDTALAGSPIRAVHSEEDVEQAVVEVEEELGAFDHATARDGVIVRADSLGSLEALLDFLDERAIPVAKAEVGQVRKQDVIEAENAEGENRAILAFNTGITEAAEEALQGVDVQFFQGDIIYAIIDAYEEWVEEVEQRQRETVLEAITRPAKIRLLPDHVFRSSGPAVVGIEVLDGVLNSGSRLMSPDGERIGRVKAIQDEGESIDTAQKGREVAVSITDATVGRQIEEGDTLYTDIGAKDYRIIQRMEDAFSAGELQVLEEIVDIKDAEDPRWKLR